MNKSKAVVKIVLLLGLAMSVSLTATKPSKEITLYTNKPPSIEKILEGKFLDRHGKLISITKKMKELDRKKVSSYDESFKVMIQTMHRIYSSAKKMKTAIDSKDDNEALRLKRKIRELSNLLDNKYGETWRELYELEIIKPYRIR